MRGCGLNPDVEDNQTFFNQNPDPIGFSKFLELVDVQKNQNDGGESAELTQVFHDIDRVDKGYITKVELRQWMDQNELDITDEDLDNQMIVLGPNDKIGLDSFVRFILSRDHHDNGVY